tara:strand:+ start:1242 stop:2762 length:1521 start_codon:yes stop_codon:yes gene_type:complete
MKRLVKAARLHIIALTLLLGFIVNTLGPVSTSYAASSEWIAGNIISDQVFTNYQSMSFDDIQRFLNSKVPSCDTYGTQTSEFGGGTRAQWAIANYGQSSFTCLKDYNEGSRSSAQIIYDVARQFRINPQVLLVLLQKEQGLVTDTWPLDIQYRSATGYGCPDTAPCDSEYYGLTNQITWSARMFRAIMDSSPTWYTPYVLGDNYIYYNPSTSCGGSIVNIQNKATKALYNYTPYQPNAATLSASMGTTVNCGAYGNINFFRYFTNWFGSPRGDYCVTSLSQTVIGINFAKQSDRKDLGVFQIYSGASTGCIEAHIWNSGAQSWKEHISTNSSSINPDNSSLQYADLNGDGKDEAILIGLRNTGSGMVEFHIWDSGLKTWKEHIISNMPAIDPSISQVSFADVDGNGKDEGVLLGVANGSTSTGKIEAHIWNEGMRSWRDHIITNANTIDKSATQLSFADLDGNGKDEAILISMKKSVSGGGNIEMHIWNEGMRSWRDHIITNQIAN